MFEEFLFNPIIDLTLPKQRSRNNQMIKRDSIDELMSDFNNANIFKKIAMVNKMKSIKLMSGLDEAMPKTVTQQTEQRMTKVSLTHTGSC